MKLSMLSKAIMSATNVAKVCRGQLAMSACICAAICLPPAAAEESYEITENVDALIQQADLTYDDEESTTDSGNNYTVEFEDDDKTIRLPNGWNLDTGEVLYAPEKLIIGTEYIPGEPLGGDATLTIQDGANINIGVGSDVAGSISIFNSTYIHEGKEEPRSAAIQNAAISVSQDAQGNAHAVITNNNNPYYSATIENAQIDLTQLKQGATVTIDDISVSSSQILQTHGSLHLINGANVSLLAESKVQDIYVDATSSFHGAAVSPNVQLSGVNNKVDFQASGKTGSTIPVLSGATINNLQLYGLTAQEGTQITLNMQEVNFDASVSKFGSKFNIYFEGLNWAPLDKLDNNRAVITDSKIINNLIVLTDFNSSFDADLVKYLTITGVTYNGANQGIQVEFTIVEDLVPEPTTATLSLLALTALAARRRRRL